MIACLVKLRLQNVIMCWEISLDFLQEQTAQYGHKIVEIQVDISLKQCIVILMPIKTFLW